MLKIFLILAFTVIMVGCEQRAPYPREMTVYSNNIGGFMVFDHGQFLQYNDPGGTDKLDLPAGYIEKFAEKITIIENSRERKCIMFGQMVVSIKNDPFDGQKYSCAGVPFFVKCENSDCRNIRIFANCLYVIENKCKKTNNSVVYKNTAVGAPFIFNYIKGKGVLKFILGTDSDYDKFAIVLFSGDLLLSNYDI